MSEEYEVICSRCKGKGIVPIEPRIDTGPNGKIYVTKRYLNCGKCFGEGSVDWVENVTKVVDKDLTYFELPKNNILSWLRK